mmetsp:Transcript_6042/g.11972  ORF Transcript_6042/g.11972 Transcript_6042/m.11972 type:complete len:260 (-) Transcript_6042:25-804(-)
MASLKVSDSFCAPASSAAAVAASFSLSLAALSSLSRATARPSSCTSNSSRDRIPRALSKDASSSFRLQRTARVSASTRSRRHSASRASLFSKSFSESAARALLSRTRSLSFSSSFVFFSPLNSRSCILIRSLKCSATSEDTTADPGPPSSIPACCCKYSCTRAAWSVALCSVTSCANWGSNKRNPRRSGTSPLRASMRGAVPGGTGFRLSWGAARRTLPPFTNASVLLMASILRLKASRPTREATSWRIEVTSTSASPP